MRKLERCPRSKPCSIKIRLSMKQNICFSPKPRMDLDGKWFGRSQKEKKRHFFLLFQVSTKTKPSGEDCYIYIASSFPTAIALLTFNRNNLLNPDISVTFLSYHLPSSARLGFYMFLFPKRNFYETMAFWSTSGSK